MEWKRKAFDTSGGLLVNSVCLKERREIVLPAKLFTSLASIPRADNRHPHFPTQFTDALGDAEARPIRSNAISLSVCFRRKLRAHHYWLFAFLSFAYSIWSALISKHIHIKAIRRKQEHILMCPFLICAFQVIWQRRIIQKMPKQKDWDRMLSITPNGTFVRLLPKR